MRIAFLVSHPIQYHAPLFRSLARQCELTVLFAHKQSAKGQSDAGYGVAFDWDIPLTDGYHHIYLVNTANRPNVSRFFGVKTRSIKKVLLDNKFDAVIVGGWNLWVYWQMVFACRSLSLPVVARGDSHLQSPRSAVKKWLKRLIYPVALNLFNAHLPVGKRSEEYLRHFNVSACRMFRSMHIVDNERFKNGAEITAEQKQALKEKYGLNSQARTIIFVGRLIKWKHVDDVISAMKLLPSQLNLQLLIVGDGPERRSLEDQAKVENVKVCFAGFQNQTALPELYALAEVLVLPSDGNETWGLVVNEAMACGIPAIVSDCVGCAYDLVVDNQTGAVYRFGSIEDLCAKISTLLSKNRNYYTLNICEQMEHYSPDNASANILRAVSTVVTGRSERRLGDC